MKKLLLLFTILATACPGFAQDIRDGSGTGQGKIEADGTIRNSSGTSVGKIDRDGTIRNSSGTGIGKVENDGTIRNGSGTSVGKVEGIDRKWAAVFFFFFRFP